LRQRQPGDLDDLPPVQIAGGEQEVRQKQNQHGLPDGGRQAHRAPHQIVADGELRRVDAHPLHAGRHRFRRRRVGRLLQFVGRLLHLLNRAALRRSIVLQQLAQPPRAARQLLDDRGRFRAQSVEQIPAAADDRAQHDRGAERPRQTVPLHPRDRRIERVAEQHRKHDRNHHRLRQLQQRRRPR
jgi:hypothetical protein